MERATLAIPLRSGREGDKVVAITRRMEGKRVLVTGAGTGIGRGVALEFGKEGATVALHYWPKSEGAESAVREIVNLGSKAKMFKADFRQIEPIGQLAKEALDFLGGHRELAF
jgi:3-oxoacyl-[acyl-carrier protein] reductase